MRAMTRDELRRAAVVAVATSFERERIRLPDVDAVRLGLRLPLLVSQVPGSRLAYWYRSSTIEERAQFFRDFEAWKRQRWGECAW